MMQPSVINPLIFSEKSGIKFYTVAATGESGISICGLAMLCGLQQNFIENLLTRCFEDPPSKRLKPLKNGAWKMPIGNNQYAVRGFACTAIISYCAFELFKVKALECQNRLVEISAGIEPGSLLFDAEEVSFTLRNNFFKSVPKPTIKKERKKSDSRERAIQLRLKKELKGATEVPTPAGRIDLLTPYELIEIKKLSDWKQALGQVLAYHAYYPDRVKRIHLFDLSPTSNLTSIESHCAAQGIKLTWE